MPDIDSATAEEDDLVERQSDNVIRNLIAREIWRYQECEEAYGDFDAVSSSSIGMAELIKQTAIDQAELIRAIILKSPVLIERIHAGAAKEEDDAYEIGKRDGYEDAIQDLDLATGGDGEFKGSTIPGQTVDVPAMKARVLAELTTLRAQLASMRDALAPFANAADGIASVDKTDGFLFWQELVIGDLRRARAALNASPGSAGRLTPSEWRDSALHIVLHLASVNLTAEAAERQARRIVDALIAQGLSHKEGK